MRPAAMRCLRELAADEECDIIRERGTVFCGDTRIASRTLDELLCATAVSRINASHGIELFVLNVEGLPQPCRINDLDSSPRSVIALLAWGNC